MYPNSRVFWEGLKGNSRELGEGILGGKTKISNLGVSVPVSLMVFGLWSVSWSVRVCCCCCFVRLRSEMGLSLP